MKCDLSHIDSKLSHVSEQAKKVIKMLLQRNPDRRPSAAEALTDQWFKDETRPV